MIDAELLLPLKQVIDPELGINIIDLGLVYEAHREGPLARVNMTMTTPACPLGSYISEDVERRLLEFLPGLEVVDVNLTFEPPWSPDRMSDAARQQLGWSR